MANRSDRTNTATARTKSAAGDSGGTEQERTTRTATPPDWLARLGPFALLIGVIVVVFGQTATFDFAPIDDAVLVTSNPLYNPTSMEHVWRPWREPVLHLYMPVTYTFYAIEAAMSQPFAGAGKSAFNPAVFHIGNLLLHCCNASLVLILAQLITGNRLAALLAALFFALHPLQAESVAWISETKGILCNCFCLAGLALLVYRIRREQLSQANWWALYAGMNLAFILALLSKPLAIVVVPIAWIISVGFLQRSALISALELVPSAAVAVLISIIAKRAQGDELLTFIPPAAMRPLIAGDTVAFYLYKLLLPFALTVDYARSPESILPTTWIWVAWLAPVALFAALALLPHRKTWLWALAIFVVSILPVSGLVSFLFQMYSTVSDRYVYLAMLGPSLAIAWFFTFYARPNLVVGFVVLLSGLALLSSQQVATWKTAESLLGHALRVTPTGYLSRSCLGNYYADAGRPQEAIEHLLRAAELRPDSVAVQHKLGGALVAAGRFSEAIPRFQEVARLKPDYAEGHNDLGVAFGKAKRPQEAIAAFEQAIQLKPEDVDFHTHLMIAYAQANEREQAMQAAERSIELARSQGNQQLAADLEAWLRKYRANQPQR